jgi:predicted component of type VI protein secretion system
VVATQVVSGSTHVRPSRSLLVGPAGIEMVPVTKAEGSPYPERISIGRARNCDVVLRNPSISKLHAHFRVGGAQMQLVDSGSQNGTRVNGLVLAPGTPVNVVPGDVVRFGSVTCRLVDAATLYDVLRRAAP